MVEIEDSRLKKTHHLKSFKRLSLESHCLARKKSVGKMKESREPHLYSVRFHTCVEPGKSLLVKRYLGTFDL